MTNTTRSEGSTSHTFISTTNTTIPPSAVASGDGEESRVVRVVERQATGEEAVLMEVTMSVRGPRIGEVGEDTQAIFTEVVNEALAQGIVTKGVRGQGQGSGEGRRREGEEVGEESTSK
jgi:hypothetical protein